MEWGSRVAWDELSRGVTTVAFLFCFVFCLVGLSCCSGLTRVFFIAAPPSVSSEVPSVVGVMEVILLLALFFTLVRLLLIVRRYVGVFVDECARVCV